MFVEASSLYNFFEYRTSQMAQRVEGRLEDLITGLNGISKTIESPLSENRLDVSTQNIDEWSKARRDGR